MRFLSCREAASFNNSMQRTALRAAADDERVCRAWHQTSQVKVLIPGIREAEG
jgi:hypothetical protein